MTPRFFFLAPLIAIVTCSLGVMAPVGNARAQQPAAADGADKVKAGEDILRLVRMSQALQDLKNLKGKLRNNDTGEEVPFDLTMADNVIRFSFTGGSKEIINLDLKENGTKLTRTNSSGKVEMPVSLYSETVKGTHLNYEDLSMRFLYWPKPELVGAEKVSFQTCWVVHVVNPDNRGPYRQVRIWVDQESGAMMKMRAYDQQGKLQKEFLVRKGQKYKDAYILKQMRVQSYDTDKNKVNGITYLEIEDPAG
jgi:hypothetical protein